MRISECERAFRIWAAWRRAGGVGAPAEECEIERFIASPALLPELKATLAQVYLHEGVTADHVRALGCPEHVLVRRLGRADRLLLDHLRSSREREKSEGVRLAMRQQLGL